MRSELKRLHHDTGSTIIYVTHDQVEALTMSTKIALFREGELVQVDKPLELYDNPCDLYTADFIGNPRRPRAPPARPGCRLTVSWAAWSSPGRT